MTYCNFLSQDQLTTFLDSSLLPPFFWGGEVLQQTQEEEKRSTLLTPAEKSSEDKSSFLKSEWKESMPTIFIKHSDTYSPRLRSQNVNAFQEEKRKQL